MPGIVLKVGGDHRGGALLAEPQERDHIEPQMARGVAIEIGSRELEEPDRRPQPPAMLVMQRMQKLLLQMHERPRDLDEPFEEPVILVLALEPEILQHVMRFVILADVESREKALIARIESQRRVRTELLHKGRDSFVFFHRTGGGRKLFCVALCVASCV